MHSSKGEPTQKIEIIQEKLSELAEILSDISSDMKKIADQRRGGLLSLEQADYSSSIAMLPLQEDQVDRAKEVSRKPTSMDPSCGIPRFRYAQYVEFSSLEEFLKFKDMPAIQSEEIADVDWQDLERRLVG